MSYSRKRFGVAVRSMRAFVCILAIQNSVICAGETRLQEVAVAPSLDLISSAPSSLVQIASQLNSDAPLPGEHNSYGTADVISQLDVIAKPSGQYISCHELATMVRAARRAACLESAMNQLQKASCHCDVAPMQQQRLARLLSSKLEQEQLRKALLAHIGIYYSTQLAIQQQSTFDLIGQFQQRQSTAIANGIAVRNPLAIQQLQLQLDDTVIQNIGANGNARSQLSLLLHSQVTCTYQPTLDGCAVQSADLCRSIEIAFANRAELQALRTIDAILCNSEVRDLRCFLPLISMLSGAVLADCDGCQAGLLSKVFGRAKLEEQRDALRKLVSVAESIVRDKIASEVTTAWHELQTAQSRTINAQQTTQVAMERVDQLKQLGNEVGVTAEELVEAEMSLQRSRVEEILRNQEWSASQLELRYVLGQL